MIVGLLERLYDSRFKYVKQCLEIVYAEYLDHYDLFGATKNVQLWN